jgi:hypothetical protein
MMRAQARGEAIMAETAAPPRPAEQEQISADDFYPGPIDER